MDAPRFRADDGDPSDTPVTAASTRVTTGSNGGRPG